jgi:hypothetical protein
VSLAVVSSGSKKDFFFEKKKQKTCALALLLPAVNLIHLARSQKDKSFLVLFFKKNLLLVFA